MAASKYLPSYLLVVILMPLSLVSAVFTAPTNCPSHNSRAVERANTPQAASHPSRYHSTTSRSSPTPTSPARIGGSRSGSAACKRSSRLTLRPPSTPPSCQMGARSATPPLPTRGSAYSGAEGCSIPAAALPGMRTTTLFRTTGLRRTRASMRCTMTNTKVRFRLSR